MLHHTNIDLEKSLRPVRYPVYRGLMGWRIFFIRKDELQRFTAVNSLAELTLMKAG